MAATAARRGHVWGHAGACQALIERYETRLAAIVDLVNERFPGGCQSFLPTSTTDGRAWRRAGRRLPHWPDGLAIHAAYNAVIRA